MLEPDVLQPGLAVPPARPCPGRGGAPARPTARSSAVSRSASRPAIGSAPKRPSGAVSQRDHLLGRQRSWRARPRGPPSGPRAPRPRPSGPSPRRRRSRPAPSPCRARSPRPAAARRPRRVRSGAGFRPRSSGTSDRAGSESSSCWSCIMSVSVNRRPEPRTSSIRANRNGSVHWKPTANGIAAAAGCPGWPWRTSPGAGRPGAAARGRAGSRPTRTARRPGTGSSPSQSSRTRRQAHGLPADVAVDVGPDHVLRRGQEVAGTPRGTRPSSRPGRSGGWPGRGASPPRARRPGARRPGDARGPRARPGRAA